MPTSHRQAASPFNRVPPINAEVMFRRCKVAALSLRPGKWDKARNADKLERFIRRAARRQPALILASEGMLEGYVVTDVIWHRERVPALLDIAEPLDGPYIRRFRQLARELRTCLCFGFAERRGRSAYNSAVFIDHRGRICGTYHKLTEGVGAHPTWTFWRPGRQVRAFDTPLGRCGMLICSDRWFPILARTLVLDGAQFILIPTYGSITRSQNQAVVARARENGVPIVQANAAGNNLVVSKGEVAAYRLGVDQITTGNIDIPRRPRPATARAAEAEFLRFQKTMERDHYRRTIAALKKRRPSRDARKEFLPEKEFHRLQRTDWGRDRSP